MQKALPAVLLALATMMSVASWSWGYAAAEGLFEAVKAGDGAAVRRFLDRGVNPNALDEYQRTPLHWAASRGMTEVAALLIQKGARVNAGDCYHETPLHHSVYWGNTEVAALLIEKGAKANASNGRH